MNPTPIRLTFALALLYHTTVQAGRVLLTLYALKFGAGPFAVGVLAAMFSALPMLLSWQVGRLVDRFGARWPLMFGGVCGVLGMLVPYLYPGIPALYLAAVMTGLLFAFCAAPLQTLVGLLSRPVDSARNFSNFSLVISTAGFTGPMLVGFSIDHAGHANACLALVTLSLVPLLLLAVRGGSLPGGTGRARPVGSIRDMLASPGLWRVLLTGSLIVTGIDLFLFYMPIYGHGIGLSASAIGVVLAMFFVSSFIVRLLIPSLLTRLGEERMLAASFLLGAAGLALTPFFKGVAVLAMVSFLFGIGMGCGQPVTLMLTFRTSEAGHSGEVLGLRITINYVSRMIGPILFGAIGSAFGHFPVFWITAAMLGSGSAFTRAGRGKSLPTT